MLITHFTSDPHYGHRNIISHCNRLFLSTEHMREELIARYNSVVPPDGVTLWGGDCFFCPMSEAATIMSRLNGRKILVLGNHDKNSGRMSSLGFDVVAKELVIDICGVTVRINHYPCQDDRFPDRCPVLKPFEMLIHGHTHSPNKVNGRQIHIGVDAWAYAPASLQEIEELVNEIKGK
jgi:calcineurin-like phosphoesterase family protein